MWNLLGQSTCCCRSLTVILVIIIDSFLYPIAAIDVTVQHAIFCNSSLEGTEHCWKYMLLHAPRVWCAINFFSVCEFHQHTWKWDLLIRGALGSLFYFWCAYVPCVIPGKMEYLFAFLIIECYVFWIQHYKRTFFKIKDYQASFWCLVIDKQTCLSPYLIKFNSWEYLHVLLVGRLGFPSILYMQDCPSVLYLVSYFEDLWEHKIVPY